VTFHHLYFSPDRRGQNAREDAVRALGQLTHEPADSLSARTLADRFMYQGYFGDRSPEQLAKEFGLKFAREIFQLPPGAWQGPIESGFGWHLIFIDTLTPRRVPAYEEVEGEVKRAWNANWRAEVQRKAYEVMRAQYEIILPKSTQNGVARLTVPPAAVPADEAQ
jgi:peptidyl-prolyl cis-trans isomerase C